jgi:hypothetical protein
MAPNMGIRWLAFFALLVITGNATAQDGFRDASIYYRGSEQIILGPAKGNSAKLPHTMGSPLPDGYHVSNFSLSGDGSTVWVVLTKSTAKETTHQVWSILTDGSGASENVIKFPDRMHAPYLAANYDGSRAFVVCPRDTGSTAFPVRQFTFQRCSRGQGTTLINDTERMVEHMRERGPIGLGLYLWPRSSKDGEALFYNDGCYIVRLRAGDGWVPLKIGDKNQIRFNGVPPDKSQHFVGLDVDAAGGRWISTIAFPTPKGSFTNLVVTGQSIPSTIVEAAGERESFASVNISSDGSRIAYTQGGTIKSRSWVGTAGKQARALKADVNQTHSIILSDDGKSIYAVAGAAGAAMQNGGFIEGTDSANRVMATSNQLYVGPVPGNHGLNGMQINHSGEVLAAIADVNPDIVGFYGGLYVQYRGRDDLRGHPKLTEPKVAFLGKDEVAVRVRCTSPGGLSRIAIQPLKDHYLDPINFIPHRDNPLFNLRNGSQSLVPVKGQPDVYEIRFGCSNLRDKIDRSYSVRLTAINAERNRAQFIDVPLKLP